MLHYMLNYSDPKIVEVFSFNFSLKADIAIQVELRSGQSETVLGANLKSNPSHWSFLFLKFTA